MLYADDETEYASDVSRMILQYVVNSDLCVLTRWLGMNHLRIDAAKTQAVANWTSLYKFEFHLIETNLET